MAADPLCVCPMTSLALGFADLGIVTSSRSGALPCMSARSVQKCLFFGDMWVAAEVQVGASTVRFPIKGLGFTPCQRSNLAKHEAHEKSFIGHRRRSCNLAGGGWRKSWGS
jgi:hypothetical protein